MTGKLVANRRYFIAHDLLAGGFSMAPIARYDSSVQPATVSGVMALWGDAASVHPTEFSSDIVCGLVYLWSKEEPATTASTALGFTVSAEGEVSSPHAFLSPLASIRALSVQSPSSVRPVGSVIVYFRGEVPERTLFFDKDEYEEGRARTNWGGHRLLEALAQFVEVIASLQEPGMYLVNPDSRTRALHLTPKFADDAIEAVVTRRAPLRTNTARTESFSDWARSTRFSLLSQFSQVTRGARQSRDALMPFLRRAAPHAAPSATRAQAGPYMISSQSDSAKKEDVFEYDAARVYLAKWAGQVAREGELNRLAEDTMSQGPARDAEELLGTSALHAALDEAAGALTTPIGAAEWTRSLDERISIDVLAQRIFRRGLAPEARPFVWPYMFGAVELVDSTEHERNWVKMRETYDALVASWHSEQLEGDELQASMHRIWIDCLRADTKHAFFHQHDEAAAQKAREKGQRSGWSRNSHGGASHARVGVSHHLYALSDVLLTFVLYAESGEDTALPNTQGYVQGMSDLCLVCYVACAGDEARTFWTFVGLMRRMGTNFVQDQSGMRHELLLLQRLVAELCPTLYTYLNRIDGLNLFFCFRWILVCFKREFELDDVLRLWDSIFSAGWTQHNDLVIAEWPLCRHFELFIALAILESHASLIMRHLKSFDELLMFIHSLSLQMDVGTVLRRAEALIYRLRSRMLHTEGMDDELRHMVLS